MLDTIIVKIKSELYGDIKINKMSVIPCRLNGDLHEWFNEVVTVPNQNLLKSLSSEHAGYA